VSNTNVNWPTLYSPEAFVEQTENPPQLIIFWYNYFDLQNK